MNGNCIKCGKKLNYNEIGLHKKMVNRGATEFMCISCLSEHFKISEEELLRKIEYFRRTGCTLFPPLK
ncbi:MAG: hypothetical protein PUC29_01275 [Clostridia bacterium]|nr:hypothetical protein [Clostridia bacterium]